MASGKEGLNMGLAEFERKRDEKINGVIYDLTVESLYH
jgi:hypothetical protein